LAFVRTWTSDLESGVYYNTGLWRLVQVLIPGMLYFNVYSFIID